MEYVLLTKVGWVINAIVKLGYLVAGGYLAKTGVRYVSDYRNSISNEKGA